MTEMNHSHIKLMVLIAMIALCIIAIVLFPEYFYQEPLPWYPEGIGLP